MPRPISTEHQQLREDLINALGAHIGRRQLKIPEIARRAKIQPHDLNKILRHERSASLTVIADVGEAAGLKFHAEWRPR